MTELSNAVTVLIARMESHPEDFDLYNGELYSKAKFGETAGALYGLAGLDEAKAGALWFLPDADKEALIAAWKKYHLAKFEKDVMERIFDDGEGARELARVEQQLQQAKIRAQMQNQMMNTAQQSPGQFVPISNPAHSSGGFLSGIFK